MGLTIATELTPANSTNTSQIQAGKTFPEWFQFKQIWHQTATLLCQTDSLLLQWCSQTKIDSQAKNMHVSTNLSLSSITFLALSPISCRKLIKVVPSSHCATNTQIMTNRYYIFTNSVAKSKFLNYVVSTDIADLQTEVPISITCALLMNYNTTYILWYIIALSMAFYYE